MSFAQNHKLLISYVNFGILSGPGSKPSLLNENKPTEAGMAPPMERGVERDMNSWSTKGATPVQTVAANMITPIGRGAAEATKIGDWRCTVSMVNMCFLPISPLLRSMGRCEFL